MKRTIKYVPLPEFLKDFDPALHERITTFLAREGVDAIVGYQNEDFWSSQFGARSALSVGPDCSTKTVEEAFDGFLGDLPSQRKYPYAAVRKDGAS